MAVYVKEGGLGGGSWRQISDGNIRVKQTYTGNWLYPSKCYVKWGDYGTGGWHDTGYASFPNPPQNLRVYGWDFNNVSLIWDGPAAGGAPAVSYQVAARDSNGNGIGQPDYDNVQAPWGNFGVGEDGYYQFYVRSKSAAGLYSSWTGPVRVHIGHTEISHDQLENRTRDWDSWNAGGNPQYGWRNQDERWSVYVGGNVYLTSMSWRSLQTGGVSNVVSGTATRTINSILDGNDWGSIGTAYNGDGRDIALGNTGSGWDWGLIVRGSGWSTTGNIYFMAYCEFWVSGIETYQEWVHYIDRYRQENSYW